MTNRNILRTKKAKWSKRPFPIQYRENRLDHILFHSLHDRSSSVFLVALFTELILILLLTLVQIFLSVHYLF